MTQASDVSNNATRADMDDISNDVNERDEARDSKLRRVRVRERKPRCVVARGRRVGRVISGTEPLNGVWGRV